MKDYDVSALIAEYHPVWEKLKMTICSFLLQEGVSLQIVITDDGSEEDYFEEAEQLFQKYHFTDYRLVKNEVNLGTVKNEERGLQECTGRYLKSFSPGDYLIGKDVLKKWCDFMSENQLAASGSDYTCYYLDGAGRETLSVQKAHPQLVGLRGSNLNRNYVLNNDIFVGAAIMCDTEIYRRYLSMISGSVKYAEDHTFRIMAYCGEKIGYYNNTTILYETGTGISTSGEDKWKKLLDADWKAANSIILNLPTDNTKLQKYFSLVSELFGRTDISKWNRVVAYLRIKDLFWAKVRITLSNRQTSDKFPMEWIRRLKEM